MATRRGGMKTSIEDEHLRADVASARPYVLYTIEKREVFDAASTFKGEVCDVNTHGLGWYGRPLVYDRRGVLRDTPWLWADERGMCPEGAPLTPAERLTTLAERYEMKRWERDDRRSSG